MDHLSTARRGVTPLLLEVRWVEVTHLPRAEPAETTTNLPEATTEPAPYTAEEEAALKARLGLEPAVDV